MNANALMSGGWAGVIAGGGVLAAMGMQMPTANASQEERRDAWKKMATIAAPAALGAGTILGAGLLLKNRSTNLAAVLVGFGAGMLFAGPLMGLGAGLAGIGSEVKKTYGGGIKTAGEAVGINARR